MDIDQVFGPVSGSSHIFQQGFHSLAQTVVGNVANELDRRDILWLLQEAYRHTTKPEVTPDVLMRAFQSIWDEGGCIKCVRMHPNDISSMCKHVKDFTVETKADRTCLDIVGKVWGVDVCIWPVSVGQIMFIVDEAAGLTSGVLVEL